MDADCDVMMDFFAANIVSDQGGQPTFTDEDVTLAKAVIAQQKRHLHVDGPKQTRWNNWIRQAKALSKAWHSQSETLQNDVSTVSLAKVAAGLRFKKSCRRSC
jgi:hypothetical protein